MVNMSDGRRLDDGDDAETMTPDFISGSKLVWGRDGDERRQKDLNRFRLLRMEVRARHDDNRPSEGVLSELTDLKKKLLDAT